MSFAKKILKKILIFRSAETKEDMSLMDKIELAHVYTEAWFPGKKRGQPQKMNFQGVNHTEKTLHICGH